MSSKVEALDEDVEDPLLDVGWDDIGIQPYGYSFIVPIKTIGFSYGSVVYRAVPINRRITGIDKTRIFAVTVAKAAQNPMSFARLRNEVSRNESVQRFSNRNVNLLETEKTTFIYGLRFCVVMPFCDMGSLRTIMVNAYPQGFPEDLIVIALRSVLNGLRSIHAQICTHRDINTGHIYLKSRPRPQIKLGFAATVYEDRMGNINASSSHYLPMVSISEWAAAPEVYNLPSVYIQQTSDKIDVWLVGITALELAYGGRFRVQNRDALEEMIKEMHTNNKLPDFGGTSCNKKKHCCVPKFCYSSTNDDPFSEAFTRMVLGCLAWDPRDRPSVDQLLSSHLFTHRMRRKDTRYFYNAVVKK